jgi:hypothetical protein
MLDTNPSQYKHWTRADAAWLAIFALLMLATMLSTIFASPVDDTWRDIYFAHRIASGEELPLRGPVIGNIAQLGPIWFYLLAPAYALAGVGGAMGTIGALSGLKFPLAFVLGRQLGGTALGAAFGLAWLMPFWNLIETGWPTHISAVASALLALALATIAYRRRPGPGRAVVLGLFASLAIHAHPTTALLAGLLVAIALLALPAWRARVIAALSMLAAASSLFVPLLLAPSLQLEPAPDNLIGLGAHANQLPLATVVERFVPVLRGLFWGPAEMQWPVLLGLSGRVLDLALAATLLAWAMVVVGVALVPRAHRIPVAIVLLVILLQTVFVLALRPITPFWMAFAHGPLLMALVGYGAASLWSRQAAWRIALGASTLAMATGSLVLLLRLAVPAPTTYAPVFAPGGSGFLSITERVVDRRAVHPIRIAPGAWERLGATLCEPTTIYGHLAGLVDISFGVGARRACGGSDQIAIGGRPAVRSLARIGLSAQATRAIDVRAPTRAEGLRVFEVAEVYSAGRTLSVVAAGRYPRRDLSGLEVERFTLEAELAPEQLVAIAWRAMNYYPIRIHAVQVDGRPVEPSYEDAALWLYRCTGCRAGLPARWTIEIEGVPALIDVLAFDPAAVAY